jgi:hypothetical protein
MPYSIKADVRLEAGKITSTVDLTDSDIDRKIAAVDKLIDDKSDKPLGWNGTETDYPRVQEISTILAAALCRMRFDPEKAQGQWDSGIALLIDLVGEGGDAGATSMVVDKGEFGTFPKNPNALWSRGRMGNQGISPQNIDPDWIYEGQDF